MTDKLPLQNVTIYDGVAGSGKTTFIEDTISKIMETESAPRILFLTYSKKLQSESERRFTKKFYDPTAENPYEFHQRLKVRTLHAYAKSLIMAWAKQWHYEGFYEQGDMTRIARKMNENGWGITKFNQVERHELKTLQSEGDLCYQTWERARTRLATDEQVVKMLPKAISADRYARFVEEITACYQGEFTDEYDEVKPRTYFDWSGMLEKAIEHGHHGTPWWDYIFIDEAQDLNPLMWKFIEEVVIHRTMNLMVMGDGDQTIYGFNGANQRYFNGFNTRLSESPAYEGNAIQIVRQQDSFRCPTEVAQFANHILRDVNIRSGKRMVSQRWERGVVKRVNYITDIRFYPTQQYMVLARVAQHLRGLEEQLMQDGVSFAHDRQSNMEELGRYVSACRTIMDMLGDTTARKHNLTALKMICEFNDTFGMDWYGANSKRLREIALKNRGLFSLADTDLDLTGGWEAVLGKAPRPYADYVNHCKNTNQFFDFDLATVKLQTLHSAKGLECDNVILLTDITKRIAESLAHDESEKFVWYVGATRAKKSLTITKRHLVTDKRHYMDI